MKRLVALTLSFLFLFLSSVSFISSAVDETYLFSEDDLLSFDDNLDYYGFSYDSDNSCWVLPELEEFDFKASASSGSSFQANYYNGYSLLFNNGDNLSVYPDWLKTIPQDVKDIMFSSNSSTFIRFTSNYTFEIYVCSNGVNLAVNSNNGRGYFFANTKIEGYALYKAAYRYVAPMLSWQLSTNWVCKDSLSTVTNVSEMWQYYVDCVLLADDTSDIYACGVSAAWKYPGYSIVGFGPQTGNTATTCFYVFPGYFTSVDSSYNSFFSQYSSTIRLKGCTDLVSLDDYNSKINVSNFFNIKNILTHISNLPSNIANSIKSFFTDLGDRINGFFDNLFENIKSLFIPDESYFQSYFSDMSSKLTEKLGFVYELPSAIFSFLNTLVSYSPAESGYFIHFPDVSVPWISSDGEMYWHLLIEERDITFEFLNEGPLSVLYSGYRSFIWLSYCLMLAQLVSKKYNSLMVGR